VNFELFLYLRLNYVSLIFVL